MSPRCCRALRLISWEEIQVQILNTSVQTASFSAAILVEADRVTQPPLDNKAVKAAMTSAELALYHGKFWVTIETTIGSIIWVSATAPFLLLPIPLILFCI